MNSRMVLVKVIASAGNSVESLLSRNKTGQTNQHESVRPEICVGAVVSLTADAHRHSSGGGVLAGGETGVVISLEKNSKARFSFKCFSSFSCPLSNLIMNCRVRSQSGSEYVYEVTALKAYARVSRAASMLMESVYFPALVAMLIDSCERNEALRSLLLNQTASFARALRPLELFGEPSCADNIQILVEVIFRNFRNVLRCL